MENKQKGFSLIELLIVVAIILIIAAIAIPNLLRSKMAANEASAVSSLRTYNLPSIVAYENTYATAPATNLGQLGPIAAGTAPSSASADLVDSLLGAAAPTKERICVQLHAGGSYACHIILNSRQPSVRLDRSAIFSHQPKWCDLPDLEWHRPIDRLRYHDSDWPVTLGGSKLGGEGQTPCSHFAFWSANSGSVQQACRACVECKPDRPAAAVVFHLIGA